MKDKAQLSLLVFGNMDTATQSKSAFELVEKRVERKDGKGNVLKDSEGNIIYDVLSQAYVPRKAGELAKALGLDVTDDADKIAAKALEDSDTQIDRMIEFLMRAKRDKSGFWTGGRSKLLFGKAGKSGRISKAKATFELVESRRPSGPSDEQIIAKMVASYRLPGESEEACRARCQSLWDKQLAELAEASEKAAKATVNVDSNKSTAEPPALPAGKTDEEILAEMEAAEKAAAEAASKTE